LKNDYELTTKWLKLVGSIPDEILFLKDEHGEYYLNRAEESNIYYFVNNLLEAPWRNQLAFGLVVDLSRNLEPDTIRSHLTRLNNLLKGTFEHFKLKKWEDFSPNEHLYKYSNGEYLNHSIRTRSNNLAEYFIMNDSQKRFVRTKFDESAKRAFERYILPKPSFTMKELRISKKGKEESERLRKSETDAVVPMFTEIRAEAHLRFNQVIRLKKAFDDVVSKVKTEGTPLPLEFHYEESEVVGERWYFQLWDKESFDLAHSEARTPRRSGKVPYFLEFLKAEKIDTTETDKPEGLWFLEIMNLGLLKSLQENTSSEQVEKALTFFKQHGYIEENHEGFTQPFASYHSGVLTQNAYISNNQTVAQGVLIDVDPIYAAIHFGMLALEMCTTSGARVNELLQISYSKDCMVKVINPEGPSQTVRYTLRMIPKGRDKLENYYVTEEVMKLISQIVKMLKQHYNGDIPKLEYGLPNRKHLFKDKKPYIFQYKERSMRDITINTCLKFLCHGMAFETQDGKQVFLKTHLLRHAFATQAVQGEGIPIDIVAILLHQKDYSVTKYYSRPTDTQVSDAVEKWHIAVGVDLEIAQVVLRTVPEMEEQLKAYKEKVGTVNKTLGGICTLDRICPKQMACLGCAAKVPQPENKEELLQSYKFFDQQEKYFKKQGVNFEVQKCRQIKKELMEIASIEKFRKDEDFAPKIQFS
jgi:hypothetical protein